MQIRLLSVVPIMSVLAWGLPASAAAETDVSQRAVSINQPGQIILAQAGGEKSAGGSGGAAQAGGGGAPKAGGGGGGGGRAVTPGGGGGGTRTVNPGGGGGGGDRGQTVRRSGDGGNRGATVVQQNRTVVRGDGDRGRRVDGDRGRRVDGDRGRDERGERRGRRYDWGGVAFYFYDGYYHGDCQWLKRRYRETGNRYWLVRYRQCRDS